MGAKRIRVFLIMMELDDAFLLTGVVITRMPERTHIFEKPGTYSNLLRGLNVVLATSPTLTSTKPTPGRGYKTILPNAAVMHAKRITVIRVPGSLPGVPEANKKPCVNRPADINDRS